MADIQGGEAPEDGNSSEISLRINRNTSKKVRRDHDPVVEGDRVGDGSALEGEAKVGVPPSVVEAQGHGPQTEWHAYQQEKDDIVGSGDHEKLSGACVRACMLLHTQGVLNV